MPINSTKTNLTDVDFSKREGKRDLRGIDLSHSSCKRANFSGLDLTGANFSGADLEGAIFEGAVLDQADFTNAHIGVQEGSVRREQPLPVEQLKKALSLAGTIFPDGSVSTSEPVPLLLPVKVDQAALEKRIDQLEALLRLMLESKLQGKDEGEQPGRKGKA